MRYDEALNIEDLRQLAIRRLPKIAGDFLEGGAEDDITLRRNRDVFRQIRFRPRTLVDVSARSPAVTLFGKTHAAPFGVAPTGMAGLYAFDADVKLARAAAAANVPFVLSTASLVTMERVMKEGGGTQWFQLYMSKDHPPAQALIERARDAGYDALVVTTDVAVQANREQNARNGFSIPFHMTPSTLWDGLLHPRWLFGVFCRTVLDSGVPRFQNLDTHQGGRIIAKPIGEFRARREALDWSDLRWIRSIWPRKLLVKGVLTPEDAVMAHECGADGVFVSNHGGRQLDGAVSPLEALPAIRAAVGRNLAIIADSGFRRGADIVKALALGADMCFTGRATLYGVAAGGEAGAAHAIALLKKEVDRVMALLGCNTVAELDPDCLFCPELKFTAPMRLSSAQPQMISGNRKW
jgi:isopentenyl diphosphate isomerase/L-lactate dehydrogenase-like FMN-dependent dehydrogenase